MLRAIMIFAMALVSAMAATPPVRPTTNLTLTKIHVVYMTHLDLGFTDTTRNVCDKYFDVFFPNAFNTSRTLRALCTDPATCPTFRWTEFPWLIQEYLDGRAGCSHRRRTPFEVQDMEQAIADDDVLWNANALNWLTEVADKELFGYGLAMRAKLNARFNKTHGTLLAKLTDTTGMSRSAIPTLAAHGVKAIHIGYNGVGGLPIVNAAANESEYRYGSSFCGPDDTGCPAEAIFRWVEPTTKTELLTMIEACYGDEVAVPESVALARAHGKPAPRTSLLHTAAAPGVALVYHFHLDNTSPPTAEQITTFWAGLQRQFPQATIAASSADAFVADVLAGDYARIPLVTKELGDSWLYGAPADPVKLSTFRAARRALRDAVAAGTVDPTGANYDSFMRRLMKGPCEHNWGLSVGSACADCRQASYPGFPNGTWPTADFAAARESKALRRYECPAGFAEGSARAWSDGLVANASRGACGYGPMEREWAAQREWMHPLPDWSYLRGWTRAPPSGAAARRWNAFVYALEDALLPLRAPQPPALAGLAPLPLPLRVPMTCGAGAGAVAVGFDAQGRIDSLRRANGGRQWAGPDNLLGRFRYVTYSQADLDEFSAEWAMNEGDFLKSGVAVFADPVSAHWEPALVAAAANATGAGAAAGCRFVMSYAMANATAHTRYGAPAALHVAYTVPGAAAGALADVALTWHNKTATRLPESMWMSFTPVAGDAGGADDGWAWSMDVMGYPVDPLDVQRRGTRFKHVVQDGGVTLTGPKPGDRLQVRMLDSALVSPGDIDHLLRYDDHDSRPDALAGGMHANLMNNLWGTAFPQWYDDDGSARFEIIDGGGAAA